jgi:hypothetical protein
MTHWDAALWVEIMLLLLHCMAIRDVISIKGRQTKTEPMQ